MISENIFKGKEIIGSRSYCPRVNIENRNYPNRHSYEGIFSIKEFIKKYGDEDNKPFMDFISQGEKTVKKYGVSIACKVETEQYFDSDLDRYVNEQYISFVGYTNRHYAETKFIEFKHNSAFYYPIKSKNLIAETKRVWTKPLLSVMAVAKNDRELDNLEYIGRRSRELIAKSNGKISEKKMVDTIKKEMKQRKEHDLGPER